MRWPEDMPWRPSDVPPIWTGIRCHRMLRCLRRIQFSKNARAWGNIDTPGCPEWEEYANKPARDVCRDIDKPPSDEKKTCATEFSGWPVCPTNMYDDRHVACEKCNKKGFRPDNHQVVSSPHFGGLAEHWTCLAPGKGPRRERGGVSIICGMCCVENDGSPKLTFGCICLQNATTIDVYVW